MFLFYDAVSSITVPLFTGPMSASILNFYASVHLIDGARGIMFVVLSVRLYVCAYICDPGCRLPDCYDFTAIDFYFCLYVPSVLQ